MAENVVGEKDTTRERDSLRNKEAKRRTPEVEDGGAQEGGTYIYHLFPRKVLHGCLFIVI